MQSKKRDHWQNNKHAETVARYGLNDHTIRELPIDVKIKKDHSEHTVIGL